MKLDRDINAGNLIRGFAEGQLLIGNQVFRHPVIVTVDQVLADWSPPDPAALTLADLQAVLDLEPEVILLGTGSRQRFPSPALTSAILNRGIGIEVMNTAAACRTFNVLASESRRVVAALFIA